MKVGIFGIDVGGTTVKIGRFSEAGVLLEKWEIPTDLTDHGKNVLSDIAAAVLKKCREAGWDPKQVSGIGMGVPGPVTKEGLVLKCANLGWDQIPAAARLTELTGIPAWVGNDANVAALGESLAGGGNGCRNTVLVTLGTGVGGGILADGVLICGANGAGGEIGHLHVCDDEETPCGCGNYGCLEQYASATGIVRTARKLLQAEETASLLREIPAETLTAKDVFDCAKQGDAMAERAVNCCCEYLGRALAAVACIVNPELFILGGGVSRAGSILIEKTEPVYQKYALHACKDARFTLASLGNDAGIYGAAHLVLSAASQA